MLLRLKKQTHKLLRRSQKYTKTDMVYLGRGSFWMSLSYFIQVGSGVITIAVLANILPKSIFGTYQFILSVAGILSVLTLSGIHKAIIRAVAQGNDGILRSALRTKMKWNSIIALSGGLIATYYAVSGDESLAYSFLIVAICLPLIEGFKVYNPFLIGKESFRDSTLLGFWRKPLPLIAVCGTAFFTQSISVLIAAYYVSSAVSYIAVYAAVIKKYNPPLVHDPETVAYSKHLSVIAILNKIATHTDKIILWHLLGPITVATYSLAQLATKYTGGLLSTVTSLILPRVARRSVTELQKSLPRKILLSIIAMGGLVSLYILAAPYLFKYIFPEYTDAVVISQALALGLLFLPQVVFGQVFIAHKKVKAQYIAGISIPLLRILMIAILGTIFGVWGVVIASLLADVLSFIVTFYLFTRLTDDADTKTLENDSLTALKV